MYETILRAVADVSDYSHHVNWETDPLARAEGLTGFHAHTKTCDGWREVIFVTSIEDITQTSALCPLSSRTGVSGYSPESDRTTGPLLLTVAESEPAFAGSGAVDDAREADGLALKRHSLVEFEVYIREQDTTYALQRKHSVHLPLHHAFHPSLSSSPGDDPLTWMGHWLCAYAKYRRMRSQSHACEPEVEH